MKSERCQWIFGLVAICTLVAMAAPMAKGNCAPGWLPAATLDLNGPVWAMTVWDPDGPGPQRAVLVAGGKFTRAGGVEVENIAQFDGANWSPVGGGVSGPLRSTGIRALATFDDGESPKLCVGGRFSLAGSTPVQNIALWNGQSWSDMNGGVAGHGSNTEVMAMTTFDDGSGPALYVGGWFVSAGGVRGPNIARWNGLSWSSVETGVSGPVRCLAVGEGPLFGLYAGGDFLHAGDVTAERIARWDGQHWRALPNGTSNPEFAEPVRALAVHGNHERLELFAAGSFTPAQEQSFWTLHSWNGSAWRRYEAGLSNDFPLESSIRALVSFDDGNGPQLYIGGQFTAAGCGMGRDLWKWDWRSGNGGSAVSHDMEAQGSGLYAFAVYDDGRGPALYVGADYNQESEASTGHLAGWRCPCPNCDTDGNHSVDQRDLAVVFSCLHGPGTATHTKCEGAQLDGDSAIDLVDVAAFQRSYTDLRGPEVCERAWLPNSPIVKGTVSSAKRWDPDGGGPQTEVLALGGSFSSVGGVPASNVGLWNGSTFSPLGAGLPGSVDALQRQTGGDKPLLYAAGSMSSQTVPIGYVAAWNGFEWEFLTNGLQASGVVSLAEFEDEQGQALYSACVIGPSADRNIRFKRWTGSSWIDLPLGGDLASIESVADIAVLDLGSGGRLFAAGRFPSLSRGPYHTYILAEWNGAAWHERGGAFFLQGGTVHAIDAFHDGCEAAIHIGGVALSLQNGRGRYDILRWNETEFTPLPFFQPGEETSALTVYDDGAGPALYAATRLNSRNSIKKWDGLNWSAIGNSFDGRSFQLEHFDEGRGPTLFVVGSLARPASDQPGDRGIARWGCP